MLQVEEEGKGEPGLLALMHVLYGNPRGRCDVGFLFRKLASLSV
jgi:hypothetical protein